MASQGSQSPLQRRYQAVRQQTMALSGPLSDEDCCIQSMPDASPVKWHLAHTTWFFETFVLERVEPAFRPHHPAFRVLFNSYYNGVGEKHPRAQRGMLTRPSLAEVRAYRRDVDQRMLAWLGSADFDPTGADAAPTAAISAGMAALVELGLQHEQQHQELMLTDVKHMLSLNPLQPAYADQTPNSKAGIDDAAETGDSPPLNWCRFDAGLVEIGHDGSGFCFDNELPRHRQFVEGFALASRLVTNGEFLAFVEAGGYQNPALWLSDGWDWVCAQQLQQPLYWRRSGPDWQEFTLHGLQPLALQRPAHHLSLFEAEAYARWVGARLPTEAEWERAAQSAGAHDGGDQPGGAQLIQLFGSAWQWTSSSYAAYPGFTVSGDTIGEYNGKFMINQYVLRGSSCATPEGHARPSYRNFFPASARWQFSGIRLAKTI
ncbi:ergothioneine biosynthesis protein EgtB [Undibacterium arcticum]|uniref:Ergothioneine biosynthesis protein EgtB n=1 Tax=Undibacterium arcticum TaxID=1762892 RepID=A0ABV7EZI7_9BURK